MPRPSDNERYRRELQSLTATEEALREEGRILETLNRTGAKIAAELDLEKVVQMVTDAGVEITGAEFGAFFYNVLDEAGESYMLYTLSGVPRSAFENFPMPRNTAVFAPTFDGQGPVRSDDITKDERYGKNHPRRGMPEGHLPVRAYLAIPVTSRSGEVLGGLFFGHSTPGSFKERHERLMLGIAGQAAIAIDNARLYQAAQQELAQRRQAEERLAASEHRLRLATEAAAIGTWDFSPVTGDLRWDDRCKALFGLSPEAEVTYDGGFLAGLHPDDREATDAAVQAALDPNGPGSYDVVYRTVGFNDGVVRWIAATGRAVFEDGIAVRFIGTVIDISERRASEAALRESEEQLRLATDAAEIGLWDVDIVNDTLFWPPRVKAMFGISPDVPVSMADFYAGLHPADREHTGAAFAAAADPARRAVYDVEYRTIGKEDGVLRWVAAKGRGIFDEQGRCVRVIGTAIDITVRKRAEEHLRLMVNELNHRVKNSLAIVQGIASQTLRRASIPAHVRDALTARLVALAQAHDILTGEKWAGADLQELAELTAQPYAPLSGASPFTIEGPSIYLPPKSAIALALAFHELATNAAKYGALSTPEGRVKISWTPLEPATRKLRLTWTETGGPEVSPPDSTGFGTRLLRSALATELQGRVDLDFRPSGVVATIDAVLSEDLSDNWLVPQFG